MDPLKEIDRQLSELGPPQPSATLDERMQRLLQPGKTFSGSGRVAPDGLMRRWIRLGGLPLAAALAGFVAGVVVRGAGEAPDAGRRTTASPELRSDPADRPSGASAPLQVVLVEPAIEHAFDWTDSADPFINPQRVIVESPWIRDDSPSREPIDAGAAPHPAAPGSTGKDGT